jgi:mono/diheme cytochrome c family protein
MMRQLAILRALLAFILPFWAIGCWKEDMGSEPKAKPMQESVFFADGTSARPLVEGTVSRGDVELDSHLYRGFMQGKPATSFPEHYPTPADGPFPTRGDTLRAVLQRGQEQFTIYCSMCHGDAGDGRGIIVERGFVPPPNYHIDRLREAPVGHIFDVITNGYGAMYSYGDRISPADRWAIVAYIRTLQISQAIPASQLDADQLRQLGGAK